MGRPPGVECLTQEAAERRRHSVPSPEDTFARALSPASSRRLRHRPTRLQPRTRPLWQRRLLLSLLGEGQVG